MDDLNDIAEEAVDDAAADEARINWLTQRSNAYRVRDITVSELFPDAESVQEDICRPLYRASRVGWLRDRVVCRDGFSMSVQDSPMVYSVYDDDLVCTHVEVGYPSEVEPMLMDWVENEAVPTNTVYGYVPLGVVLAVIEKHGGRVGWSNPMERTIVEDIEVSVVDACGRAA